MAKSITPLSLFWLAFILAVAICGSCQVSCSTIKQHGANDTVDCTSSEYAGLGGIAGLLKDVDQDTLLSVAESAGFTIGGCIIADLVDQWLADHKLTVSATAPTNDPRATLDKFRAVMGPGTFTTKGGVH